MTTSKINCWEFKKCGREPGGANVEELGVCPATIERKFDEIHCGKNAGRTCWAITGTLCGNEVQGTFAKKLKSCVECDFYKFVKDEESDDFIQNNVFFELSEKRISTILDNMSDCIITIDNNGSIESINKAVTNIFGYSELEIIDKNINTLIPELSIDAESDFYINEKSGYSTLPEIIDGKFEFLGTKKDGTIFSTEISINKITLASKTIFIIFISDITQRKELDKLKNDFISTISHELRTPLTSIRGSIGLIISGALGDLSDKAKTLLDIANNNSIRLINLINDILDSEKIKAGKMNFEFDEYPIMNLVEETIQYNNEYAKQYNVRYEIKERLAKAFVKVDKDKFIQVLTNLLSNAAKFSTPNEVVEIYVKRNKRLASVSVINKGYGIPEESYSKIFEAFSQVDSSDTRKKGGTGLGLNISKLIVQKMGGTIGFNSTVNDKTTFFFEFPEVLKDVKISK